MLAALALLAMGPLAPIAPQVPNAFQDKLLVIDLDDVGFDLLEDATTPTLDYLKDNGRFYTAFMTAPTCSPTRAMFNTGAYPAHPEVLVGEVINFNSQFKMPVGALVPLGTLVASAGYSTAKIGKWHLCDPVFVDHPQECGWQFYSGAMGNVQAAGLGFSRFDKNVNGTVTPSVGVYLTSDETNDAISAVNAGIQLISLSYHAPHSPWHEPPAGLFPARPLPTDRDKAAAMLEACDTEMGRLLAVAIPLGYTVIVFADNGTAQPIGGQKGTFFEGGIINPMWAFGPGVEPGVDHSRVAVNDLYPTIANLFGIAAGRGSGFANRGPDSETFIDSLRGSPVFRRYTYVDRCINGVDPREALNSRWRRVLRGERFKYVQNRIQGTTSERLFDYVADPAEGVNLLNSALSAGAEAFLGFGRRLLFSI